MVPRRSGTVILTTSDRNKPALLFLQVCGLKWSPDDRELASGGNDNQLYIWNLNSQAPLLKFSDHSAAVKVGDLAICEVSEHVRHQDDRGTPKPGV